MTDDKKYPIKRPDGTIHYWSYNGHFFEKLKEFYNIEGWYIFQYTGYENYFFRSSDREITRIAYSKHIDDNRPFSLLQSHNSKRVSRRNLETICKMRLFI